MKGREPVKDAYPLGFKEVCLQTNPLVMNTFSLLRNWSLEMDRLKCILYCLQFSLSFLNNGGIFPGISWGTAGLGLFRHVRICSLVTFVLGYKSHNVTNCALSLFLSFKNKGIFENVFVFQMFSEVKGTLYQIDNVS